MSHSDIRRISAAETQPLRHQVLRPHQSLADTVYAGDDHALSWHGGCFIDGQLMGVASIYPEAPADRDLGHAHVWRLRGMAMASEIRGQGQGAGLLDAAVHHARDHGGEMLWCHARTPATGFYQRQGWVGMGEPYEVPGIGPHLFMTRRLKD